MFLYSVWRGTSLSTRMQIARVFGIAKVGPTHVKDNYVESDGYKIEDVERALTVEAIQKYTNTSITDMKALFDLLVAKIEGREIIEDAVTSTTTDENKEAFIDEPVKPKRKYTKKK